MCGNEILDLMIYPWYIYNIHWNLKRTTDIHVANKLWYVNTVRCYKRNITVHEIGKLTIRKQIPSPAHTTKLAMKGTEMTTKNNLNEETNGRVYVQNNKRQKRYIAIDTRQLLNDRLLTLDRHIQKIAG